LLDKFILAFISLLSQMDINKEQERLCSLYMKYLPRAVFCQEGMERIENFEFHSHTKQEVVLLQQTYLAQSKKDKSKGGKRKRSNLDLDDQDRKDRNSDQFKTYNLRF